MLCCLVTVNLGASVIGTLAFSFTLALIYLKIDIDLLHGYGQLKNLFGQRASVNRNPNLQTGINLPKDGLEIIALLQSTQERLS